MNTLTNTSISPGADLYIEACHILSCASVKAKFITATIPIIVYIVITMASLTLPLALSFSNDRPAFGNQHDVQDEDCVHNVVQHQTNNIHTAVATVI